MPAIGGLKSSDIKTLIDRVKSITDGLTKIKEATENQIGPEPRIRDGYYDPEEKTTIYSNKLRMDGPRGTKLNGSTRGFAKNKEARIGDTLGGNPDVEIYPKK